MSVSLLCAHQEPEPKTALRQGPWPSRNLCVGGDESSAGFSALAAGPRPWHILTPRAGVASWGASDQSLQEPLGGQSRNHGPEPCCAWT